MTELVVEDEQYLNPVPRSLRDVAVLVEPLTVAEKGLAEFWQIQQRLPWVLPAEPGESPAHGRNALVLGAGPIGLLGAMKLVLEGFETTVYSRTFTPSNVVEDLVKRIGARFVHSETTDVATLAGQIGNIDVVYEAVGAESLAFELIPHLGTNGVFIFTGVPGRKGPIPIDADTIMRDLVLKNQIIFGTVNAAPVHFRHAISDIGSFMGRWPDAVRALITRRFPIDRAAEPLAGKSPGIKNVIAVSN